MTFFRQFESLMNQAEHGSSYLHVSYRVSVILPWLLLPQHLILGDSGFVSCQWSIMACYTHAQCRKRLYSFGQSTQLLVIMATVHTC